MVLQRVGINTRQIFCCFINRNKFRRKGSIYDNKQTRREAQMMCCRHFNISQCQSQIYCALVMITTKVIVNNKKLFDN